MRGPLKYIKLLKAKAIFLYKMLSNDSLCCQMANQKQIFSWIFSAALYHNNVHLLQVKIKELLDFKSKWKYWTQKVLIRALEQTCFYKWNFAPMGKFNLFPPSAPPPPPELSKKSSTWSTKEILPFFGDHFDIIFLLLCPQLELVH